MKKIFLILLISLITISASFALSDNLTVENVTADDGVSDDVDLTNDTNIDNISNDVKSDSKKTVFNHSSYLYKDYLNGFEGFIANLYDVEYAMYYNKHTNMVDRDSVKYYQSENLKDFDILLFSYKKDILNDTYAFHTNSDLIDLDNSKVIPAYIVGDSIYVGQPKDDDNVTLKGYISLLNGRVGKVTSANSNNQTAAGDDNTTSLLDDQSPVLDQNDTGNVTENSSEVSKHNSVLETGGPVVALLVSLLVSIVGFRRKD